MNERNLKFDIIEINNISINRNAPRLFFMFKTKGHKVIRINNSYEFFRVSLVLNTLIIYENKTNCVNLLTKEV